MHKFPEKDEKDEMLEEKSEKIDNRERLQSHQQFWLRM
jgi:hypothetical protein